MTDLSDMEVYWLPLRDHVEMILSQQKPRWLGQRHVALHIPVQNTLSAEKENSFEGLRWYSMEMARMRAFAIFSNYYKCYELSCKTIQDVAHAQVPSKDFAKKLLTEFETAFSYLMYSLKSECLFGRNSVDFFRRSVEMPLKSALQACALALSELSSGEVPEQRIRQLCTCVDTGMRCLRDCSFTYEALRRRYLFSAERSLSAVLESHTPES